MERTTFMHAVRRGFATHRVVAILGPRQCGKTTLARMFASAIKGPVTVFDLEDSTDLTHFEEPKSVLAPLRGLVVIDEIQRRPDLFPLLRVLADRPGQPARFLILGSASRDLIRQSSESLAGRIAYLELTPFSFLECRNAAQLWLRGGFPPSYLARTDAGSWDWRKSYVMTFLERDVPGLGIQVAPHALRRFWAMVAHYHGCICNFSEIGRSMGCADTTVRRYLDILSGTFMVRQLHPWLENIGKRQVKQPKVYFRDSGILHSLLGIATRDELVHHPKLGASWEGYALEEVIRAHRAQHEDCYFWATHNGAELDLMIVERGRRRGFEFKFADAPRLTRSMSVAVADLHLDSLTVIVPEGRPGTLGDRIAITPLQPYLDSVRAG